VYCVFLTQRLNCSSGEIYVASFVNHENLFVHFFFTSNGLAGFKIFVLKLT